MTDNTAAKRERYADTHSSEVLLFIMAKERRPKKSGASSRSDPESNAMTDESEVDEADLLLSLGSQQAEERSCKDILKEGASKSCIAQSVKRSSVCVCL